MADDGRKDICYRQWTHPEARPGARPRAVFLLVHGLGAHTGRWEAMADFFLKRGIPSYAIELDRTKGFREYFNDIMRLYDIIAKESPSDNVFLAGESLGALTAFMLASSRPGIFRGLICISPAFANKIRLSAPDYLNMLLALLYGPKKPFRVPFDSSMCTRDPDYRKKMDEDPRERRTASAGLLAEIMFCQLRARYDRRMKTPALFLVAGEDKIIDHAATRQVFDGLAVEDKTLVEFPGMYHALTIDVGKEEVFQKIAEWAEKRMDGGVK